jgi:ankyrin repeat protein
MNPHLSPDDLAVAESNWALLPEQDERALFQICAAGDSAQVREFLLSVGDRARSLCNAEDPDDDSPLHVAAMRGLADVCAVLLEFGAS